MGSYVALAMTIYNVHLLRQKILKNAIHITKSNKPLVVKSVSLLIGSLYFAGLYTLWHIPSIGAEIAVRVYVASEVTATNYLVDENKNNLLRGEKMCSIL